MQLYSDACRKRIAWSSIPGARAVKVTCTWNPAETKKPGFWPGHLEINRLAGKAALTIQQGPALPGLIRTDTCSVTETPVRGIDLRSL